MIRGRMTPRNRNNALPDNTGYYTILTYEGRSIGEDFMEILMRLLVWTSLTVT